MLRAILANQHGSGQGNRALRDRQSGRCLHPGEVAQGAFSFPVVLPVVGLVADAVSFRENLSHVLTAMLGYVLTTAC